jgi:3-hydroxyisobutyrate dehydrogenase
MTSIAFLGLGSMGSRMAARLIAAGHDVTVWNRNPEPGQSLGAQGAKVAATARDAVRAADVVISMLRDDVAARSVWLDGGVLGAMRRDAMAVECSTLTVHTIKALAASAQQLGIGFVDAPVAGSLPQAEAGQLVFMAGGTAEAVARLEPVLLAMGGSVQHAGPLGSGAAVKLMVNALFASQVAVLGELLGLAGKLGVAPQRALEVIAATPSLSPAAKGAGMGMLARNFAPMFPVDLLRKDMGYTLQEAEGSGSALPMVGTVARVLDAAAEAGWGDRNLTVLAQLYD